MFYTPVLYISEDTNKLQELITKFRHSYDYWPDQAIQANINYQNSILYNHSEHQKEMLDQKLGSEKNPNEDKDMLRNLQNKLRSNNHSFNLYTSIGKISANDKKKRKVAIIFFFYFGLLLFGIYHM